MSGSRCLRAGRVRRARPRWRSGSARSRCGARPPRPATGRNRDLARGGRARGRHAGGDGCGALVPAEDPGRADVTRARGVVGWHRLRWTVEPVFRTPEGAGTDAEGSQAVEGKTLRQAGRNRADRCGADRANRGGARCSDRPTPERRGRSSRHADAEIVLRQARKPDGAAEDPYADHTLGWFACIVARLGGCSGYRSKGYSNPTE